MHGKTAVSNAVGFVARLDQCELEQTNGHCRNRKTRESMGQTRLKTYMSLAIYYWCETGNLKREAIKGK
jgi:hypothetical protein